MESSWSRKRVRSAGAEQPLVPTLASDELPKPVPIVPLFLDMVGRSAGQQVSQLLAPWWWPVVAPAYSGMGMPRSTGRQGG